MDLIRAALRIKSTTQTVVEEKKEVEEKSKVLDLKSLEEQVATMSKSGCGCYRYPARALFAQYSVGTPEETVQAYRILREKIHSSCNGKSYTSSNLGTVRQALDASYTALERAAPEKCRELLMSLGSIAYDLECDGKGYSELFTDSHVQRLSTLAAKWMGEEEYVSAVEALVKAEMMAKKTQNATAAAEMIEGLMKTYRPRAIAALSKGGRSTIQDLRTVIDYTTNGELGRKMLERLGRVRAVRADDVDRFTDEVEYCYGKKMRPIERKVADTTRRYADQKSTLEREAAKGREGYDRSIDYLQESKGQTAEVALCDDLEIVIGAKLAEKSVYEKTMQERVVAIDLEKAAAIQPLQEQIDSLKQSLDSAVKHYTAGTMTRVEYKALDHEMRAYNREMKKK